MIDFGGWWDNWEWSGALYTEVPKPLKASALIAGMFGLVCVVGTWAALGVSPPPWALGALVVALTIDGITHGLADEWDVLLVAYGVAAFAAGVLACLAHAIPAPATGHSFAALAPCLVLAAGPITSRALGATVFAHAMVEYAHLQREQVERGLAGEPAVLVARVRSVTDEAVDLVTLGEHERVLRATWEVLGRRPKLSAGDHLVVLSPSIGDLDAPDGYRNNERARRLVACASSRYLGSTVATLPASRYWSEVRAGIVFLVLEHAGVGIIAVVLA